ncbi:MAG: CapA family protein [Tuberibacillus sp.]
MLKYKVLLFIILFFLLLIGCSYTGNTARIDKPILNIKEMDMSNYHLEAPPEQPITIKITGDILLDSTVGQDIDRYGVDYPFAGVKNLLTDADLTVGNLETSVSERGTPQEKEFTFRSKPKTLQGLVHAGYDAVTIANNHTMDYGRDALLDTITYLDQYHIGHTGAGRDEASAFEAYYTTIKGKRIAIIGLSRVLPNESWYGLPNRAGIAHSYHDEPMYSYVKKAVQNSDYTIVYIHWNKERMDYPEAYARTMAKAFIDLGVDAVIGSHSHSLMGIEMYKGAPIFYSMGNFVFTPSSNPKGSETMIAELTLNGGKVEKTSIVPAKIIKERPTLMDYAYNQYILNKITRLSFHVHVDEKGNIIPN